MSEVYFNDVKLTGKFNNLANKINGLTRTQTVGATAVTNAIALGMSKDGNLPADVTSVLESLPADTVIKINGSGSKQSNRQTTVGNLLEWLKITAEIAPLQAQIDEISEMSRGLIEHESNGESATGESVATFADLAELLNA